MKTRYKLILARIGLWGCIIGWPVSQLTVAKHEPTFTLALSWAAMVFTMATVVNTLELRMRDE